MLNETFAVIFKQRAFVVIFKHCKVVYPDTYLV